MSSFEWIKRINEVELILGMPVLLFFAIKGAPGVYRETTARMRARRNRKRHPELHHAFNAAPTDAEKAKIAMAMMLRDRETARQNPRSSRSRIPMFTDYFIESGPDGFLRAERVTTERQQNALVSLLCRNRKASH